MPHAVTLSTAPVCNECFWLHQESPFRSELARVYRERTSEDPLVRAEMHYLLAHLNDDRVAFCAAVREFDAIALSDTVGARRLLASETVAFAAADCRMAPGPQFRRAAAAARSVGQRAKARVYEQIARGAFHPLEAAAPILGALRVPPGTAAYVLGASAIRVGHGAVIVSQVERVVRDWLSYQLGYAFSPRDLRPDELLAYHEGARLREILKAANARLLPATGVLAIQVEDRWLAMDERGSFRFEVLPDKIQYPTTRSWNGVALLVDTHGVSALVEPALRTRATLVVGCGDSSAKMQAAAYLGRRGVNVYYPCDLYADEVLGYEGPGVLLGSAPVRSERDGAIIGDQPVVFRVSEPVIVERTARLATLRYYDAPARYFARLAEALPLQVTYVDVDDAGQADRVVVRARALGAHAIAARVWTGEDYAAIRDWLAESGENRAVLFHSVAYADGERLFREFPAQTTFGDARPRFLAAATADGSEAQLYRRK